MRLLTLSPSWSIRPADDNLATCQVLVHQCMRLDQFFELEYGAGFDFELVTFHQIDVVLQLFRCCMR